MFDQTVARLQRARELNRQTFTGASAATLGWAGTTLPGAGYVIDPKAAAATREYGQIMSMEAIKGMSQTLKGATTDKEMGRFESILSDPSTPPDIRERTIDRMLTLAQRQRSLAAERVEGLRNRDYFKPGRGQGDRAPAAPSAPQPQGQGKPAPEARFGELTAGGMSKAQAYRQMAQEGY